MIIHAGYLLHALAQFLTISIISVLGNDKIVDGSTGKEIVTASNIDVVVQPYGCEPQHATVALIQCTCPCSS